MIMELLYMDWDLHNDNYTYINDNTFAIFFEGTIGATQTSMIGLSDPRCFFHMELYAAQATSGAVSWKTPLRFNFQDANGYGYLLATDSFHLAVKSSDLTPRS